MHIDVHRLLEWLQDAAGVLVWLLPIVAWLIDSPLGSRLPKRAVAVLTFLNGTQARLLLSLAGDRTMSKADREAKLVHFLLEVTAGTAWQLTDKQALAAARWILGNMRQAAAAIPGVRDAIT